jgi:hypothetical protein
MAARRPRGAGRRLRSLASLALTRAAHRRPAHRRVPATRPGAWQQQRPAAGADALSAVVNACGLRLRARDGLDHALLYRTFRQSLFELEHWPAAPPGTPAPWCRITRGSIGSRSSGRSHPRATRPPDYVVVLADAETNELPAEQLKSRRCRVVQHFEYPYRGVPGPPMDFVNLPVDVYVYTGGRSTRGPRRTRRSCSSGSGIPIASARVEVGTAYALTRPVLPV